MGDNEKSELLEQLKLSLRLDMEEDDELLNLYIDAASSYIKGAVGDSESFWEDDSIKPMFKTALIAQASGYYAARTSLTNIPMYPINMAVNSIVGQMRGRYEVYLELKDVADENQSKSI